MVNGIQKISDETKSNLISAGISEEEIRVLESFRMLEYGELKVYKREGKLVGRIEMKITY